MKLRQYKELDIESPAMIALMGSNLLDSMDYVQQELRKLPTNRQLVLVEELSGLEVVPQDVGVGVSQVLPVVVAALDGSAEIIAVEQPELHIHPAIQVGLGDLFASLVQDGQRTFILETHSEHLLLRLLRRIRETGASELPPEAPPLVPEQLSVLYVEQHQNGMSVTPLRVDPTGEFIDRWPKGFFEERGEELFGCSTNWQ